MAGQINPLKINASGQNVDDLKANGLYILSYTSQGLPSGTTANGSVLLSIGIDAANFQQVVFLRGGGVINRAMFNGVYTEWKTL